jgi:hypothetical protein
MIDAALGPIVGCLSSLKSMRWVLDQTAPFMAKEFGIIEKFHFSGKEKEDAGAD